jgi:sugar transferase EpsL
MILSYDTPISKRLFDLTLTILGLIIVSPILFALVVVIWLLQGSPILFQQKRPGLHGKIFTIYKFRTMRDERDENDHPKPDEERITPLGKFLRTTSLDELPALINVLKGEMSLVGPRPLLIEYLPRYSVEQARRHETLPGITGWAQINGRNALSWHDRFRLDVWYVDHWSLMLDIKILLITLWKVIKREGISEPGFATAQKFQGNQLSEKENDE